jgi:transposase
MWKRPMWKPEHRIAADGSGLRYPSDLTGAEWAVVEPMVPPAKHGGRKRTIDVRRVLNGIFYVRWPAANGRRCPKTCRPDTRFRMLRQNRRRLHPPRHDPHHAEARRCKLLVMIETSRDGL